MRIRQLIEELERLERLNPELKDWDVRVASHDDRSNNSNIIVENVRVTGKGVQIVSELGPIIRRG